MKPYFSKLLTEKERRGSRARSKKTGGRVRYIPDHDYDEEPIRLPISRRRQYGYDGKELSDSLNPLFGILLKNVGRPWDKVYSELCAGLDRRSVSGLHVFQHMKDYVETKTFIGPDGSVWAYDRGGDSGPISSYWKDGSFYVHPKTGLLRHISYTPRHVRRGVPEKKAKPIDRINLTDGTYFGKENDVWYHFSYVIVQESQWRPGPLGGKWYTVSKEVIGKKRQVGKRELKKVIEPHLATVVD